jgi:hypothetical protein
LGRREGNKEGKVGVREEERKEGRKEGRRLKGRKMIGMKIKMLKFLDPDTISCLTHLSYNQPSFKRVSSSCNSIRV